MHLYPSYFDYHNYNCNLIIYTKLRIIYALASMSIYDYIIISVRSSGYIIMVYLNRRIIDLLWLSRRYSHINLFRIIYVCYYNLGYYFNLKVLYGRLCYELIIDRMVLLFIWVRYDRYHLLSLVNCCLWKVDFIIL